MKYLEIDPIIINPSINNKSVYKTNFGGFLTSIQWLLVVLFIVAFGRDLFEKNNPNVILSDKYNGNPFLAKDDINIAIAPMWSGGGTIKILTNTLNYFLNQQKLILKIKTES